MGTLQGLCIRQEGALEDKYVSVAEGVSVAAAESGGAKDPTANQRSGEARAHEQAASSRGARRRRRG